MTRITVRVEGHYEVHEAPFSRSYEWHPPSVTLVCDCGQELTLSSTKTILTCRCGADHSAVIWDKSEKAGCGMRSPTPGATTLKSRHNNI